MKSLDMNKMPNPIGYVQNEIAEHIGKIPWFKEHGVEIVCQNKQAMAFILQKSIALVNHVLVIVGVDRLTNNYPALECTVTISCAEHVMTNRGKQGFVTAIDVCQAIVQVLDGEQWHFFNLDHTTEPGTDTLQATATFKGLIDRAALLNDPTEV